MKENEVLAMIIGRAIELRRQLESECLETFLCGPPRLCILCVEMFARKPPSKVLTSVWRGDVLAERLAAVQEGRTVFVEWDDAKPQMIDDLLPPPAGD